MGVARRGVGQRGGAGGKTSRRRAHVSGHPLGRPCRAVLVLRRAAETPRPPGDRQHRPPRPLRRRAQTRPPCFSAICCSMQRFCCWAAGTGPCQQTVTCARVVGAGSSKKDEAAKLQTKFLFFSWFVFTGRRQDNRRRHRGPAHIDASAATASHCVFFRHTGQLIQVVRRVAVEGVAVARACSFRHWT